MLAVAELTSEVAEQARGKKVVDLPEGRVLPVRVTVHGRVEGPPVVVLGSHEIPRIRSEYLDRNRNDFEGLPLGRRERSYHAVAVNRGGVRGADDVHSDR